MAEGESSAHRCSDCDVNWPVLRTTDSCPLCGKLTWVAPRTRPIDHSQAADLMKDHKAKADRSQEFENYYVERVTASLDYEWARFGQEEEEPV